MNYLQKKKLAFMSIVNQVKGFVRTLIGALPLTLEGCVDGDCITDYKIYGQSAQEGTPTPDNPIEVKSVGEYDETTNKYKIPITVSGYGKYITTNIYLDEPLRKVGDYADYIDFENSKVVRNIMHEKITTVASRSSNGLIFLSVISKKPFLTGSSINAIGYAVSNKFEQHTGTYASGSNQIENCIGVKSAIQTYITGGGLNRVAYVFKNNSITTVNLAQNAIGKDGFDVYYVLAESVEESVILPKIPTFKGTTVLSADTTIQPSNAEIEYYSTEKE